MCSIPSRPSSTRPTDAALYRRNGPVFCGLATWLAGGSHVATVQLSAHDEAEQLRNFAADLQAQDPDFALDLFAAADRHEIEAALQAGPTPAAPQDDYSLPQLRQIIAKPVSPVSATV